MSARLGIALVLVLAVAAAGCSRGPKPKAAVADPAPPPVAVTPAIGSGSSSGDSLATKKASGRPKNGSATAARVPSPAQEPAPNARSGGSSSAPAAAVPDTTALLEPPLSSEERAKLEEKTKSTIAEARTRLESVDVAKLDAERLRKFRLASDYLSEAVRARDSKDLQRAQNLAHKAKLLAEEL